MPAEWEPHKATWMAFPHNRGDWPGKYEAALQTWVEIVRVLSEHEPVNILVSTKHEDRCVAILRENHALDYLNIALYNFPTDRSWVRDTAPIFTETAAILFQFNGWSKYKNHKQDARVAARICHFANTLPVVTAEYCGNRVVLEGGAIDVNGAGMLMATKECLLSKVQERNADITREGYEYLFEHYLGINRVIWLEGGIESDDTHGHIDDVARFVGPNTVLAAIEHNTADPNHAVLAKNLEILHDAGLTVCQIPMPSPVYYNGERLPASYCNFYVANEVVLVCVFNDNMDSVVISIIKECFPDRKVIGIYCRDYVLGLGTIHCSTMQQPA